MALVGQLARVTGNRRLKRNQGAELNARLSMLPEILAAEQAAKQQEETAAYRNKQLALEKRAQRTAERQDKQRLQFQREQASKEMGLAATKLGATGLYKDFGFNVGARRGGAGTGVQRIKYKDAGLMAGNSGPASYSRAKSLSPGTPAGKQPGFFSNLNIGGGLQGGLSGGLMGFGLSSMFGGNKKHKMLGAGLGAIGGSLWGSGALSGITSGIGSFLGKL